MTTTGTTVLVWRFCRGSTEAQVVEVRGKVVTAKGREGTWSFRQNTRGMWREVYRNEAGRWVESGAESATMTEP